MSLAKTTLNSLARVLTRRQYALSCTTSGDLCAFQDIHSHVERRLKRKVALPDG